MTLGVNGNGDVLKTQLIFGGKTNRCHPDSGKSQSSSNMYYTHSTSHWQNPETFLGYIHQVLIPYRNETIRRRNYSPDQKFLLLLDLHYSHFTDVTIEEDCVTLLRDNGWLLVYIPAGCTDIFQVLDVVVNAVYKSGVRSAFCWWLKKQLDEFFKVNTDNSVPFIIDFRVSAMKSLLPSFVQKGLEYICTDEMKASIKDCFLQKALLQEALSPDIQNQILMMTEEQKDELFIRNTDHFHHLEHDDNEVAAADIGEDVIGNNLTDIYLHQGDTEEVVILDDDSSSDDDDAVRTDADEVKCTRDDDSDLYAQHRVFTSMFRNFMNAYDESDNNVCTVNWEYSNDTCIIVQVYEVGGSYNGYKGIVLGCKNRKYDVFLQRNVTNDSKELDIFTIHTFPKHYLYKIAAEIPLNK